MKKYYVLKKGESEESWYGSESVCCIDRKELDRLCREFSRESGESMASLRRCWREATPREIAELGVYDSPKQEDEAVKKTGFYIIGGQYRFRCYGWAPTLLGAKRIASRHDELWDNWQGWHRPKIYAAEDCIELDGEYSGEIVPDRITKVQVWPVASYDMGMRRWFDPREEAGA